MNDSASPPGKLPADLSVWRAIAASWLSMKTWVKVWLFFLNALFLAAVLFWDRPSAQWILAGYVASGPLLLAIMVMQRGLTRLLGLAHLIPWMPLLGYILLRLTSDRVGAPITANGEPVFFVYLVLLLAAVVVCLALDIIDVWRWIAGERYVLGSEEAVKAGASKPAPLSSEG